MSIQDNVNIHKLDIIKLFQDGMKQNRIAKIYKVNNYYIHTLLKEAGLMTPGRSNYGNLSQFNDAIIKMVNEGHSGYSIAKKLSFSKPCVSKQIKLLGLSTASKSTKRLDPLNQYSKDIINYYLSGLSTYKVGKLYGCAQTSIWEILKKAEIQCRDKSIYQVNESYFDVIDTKERAYWLGWMYADGNTNNSGKMRLQIMSLDRYILEQFRLDIGYDGPLYDMGPPKKFPHRKPQSCLSINRKRLTDKLINNGCMPKKSLILEFPTESQVPDHLLSHFIRGYFDGDGHISKKNCFMMVSTESFFKDMCLRLPSLLTKNHKLYKRRVSIKPTRQFYMGRRRQVMSLLNYLYQDSEGLRLERKYTVYTNLVNQTSLLDIGV